MITAVTGLIRCHGPCRSGSGTELFVPAAPRGGRGDTTRSTAVGNAVPARSGSDSVATPQLRHAWTDTGHGLRHSAALMSPVARGGVSDPCP
jgi:hypothetical protein